MLDKKNKGFTLVELLVVVAIIGILAVVAVPNLVKSINKGKVAELQADYKTIKSAVLSYYTDNGTLEGLNICSQHDCRDQNKQCGIDKSQENYTNLTEYMEHDVLYHPFPGGDNDKYILAEKEYHNSSICKLDNTKCESNCNSKLVLEVLVDKIIKESIEEKLTSDFGEIMLTKDADNGSYGFEYRIRLLLLDDIQL